jgi:hypothetical protein
LGLQKIEKLQLLIAVGVVARNERFLTWSVCGASTLRSILPPRRSTHHQLVANESLCGQDNACRYSLLLDLSRYTRRRFGPFLLAKRL